MVNNKEPFSSILVFSGTFVNSLLLAASLFLQFFFLSGIEVYYLFYYFLYQSLGAVFNCVSNRPFEYSRP